MITHLFSRIALALALVAPASAARAIDQVAMVETGSGSSTRWPAYIAADTGIFKKYNLEVEFIPAPASSSVIQQVASGSVPMGSGNPVDALRAIDRGAPIGIRRVESAEAPYEFFGKPTIKKMADLKGKTIMIGGIKDITRFYVEKMLAPSGLKSGDFDYVFAGATSQRYAALQSGSIDATILAAPFNFKARNAGFTNFGPTSDYVNGIPFSIVIVNVPWARKNMDIVDRYSAAIAEGVEKFYDPAFRDQAIDILQKRSKADREDVALTYDFFIKLGALERTGLIDPKALGEVVNLLKAQGDLEGSADVLRFIDTSLGAKLKL
jgi:NitT/TauT family transport system substrate-binding protein